MNKKVNIHQVDETASSSSESDIGSEYMLSDTSDTSEHVVKESISLTQPEMAWTGYNEETSHHIPIQEPGLKAEPGLRKDLSQMKEPIDFFTLFFNDKFVDDICTYTHMYHRDMSGRREKRRDSHQRQWTKPDRIEMRAFLGSYYLQVL